MKIKKFTGKTFQEAFESVKQELGANAVILNSRKIKEGGLLDFIGSKELYEITAAVDDSREKNSTHANTWIIPKAYHNTAHRKLEEGKNGNGAISAVLKVDEKIKEQTYEIKLLQDEIKDIKKVLNQVSEFLKYSKMPALPDTFKILLKRLVNNEVHEDLAKAIIQTVYSQTNYADYKNKNVVFNNLFSLLMRMVKVADPLNKTQKAPNVVALVGPTGVGKTTTIAKLAATMKLHYNRKVAILSADTYRIAAIEQLQTFANIANIPMDVVYSPEDMREAILKFRDRDLIFIDTVGRSQKNKQHLQELAKFIEAANPDEVHLVLSLTTGLKNLMDIIQRFSLMHPNRLIFTKLDEAINTGNVINVLYKHQIPVSYLTNGQVVPNDIVAAEKQALANLIFKGVLN